ncbi:hypothetical protein AB0L68_36540 [Streptomyces sp. NPDC052164]|uniref:hypothetical protein n=1 Tax=Streptomyces sp. NPDC052164 TaxID=3155529 RepID=UPI0034340B4D
MTDPVSAGASAAAKAIATTAVKQLLTQKGPRLGGREERREVYARFQAAMVELSSFAQFLRLEKEFSGPLMSRSRTRELLSMLHARQTELLLSVHELRLVGNPEPITSAEKVMGAGSELMGKANRVSVEEFDVLLRRAIDAQYAFTEVCRADLWYLPRWWQIHRIGWWRARWTWPKRGRA